MKNVKSSEDIQKECRRKNYHAPCLKRIGRINTVTKGGNFAFSSDNGSWFQSYTQSS